MEKLNIFGFKRVFGALHKYIVVNLRCFGCKFEIVADVVQRMNKYLH